MKDFSDLVFVDHPNVVCGFDDIATMFFGNGYGVSVITGRSAYTSNEFPFEVAVLIGKDGDWDLCYSSGITCDVIGHQTDDGVSSIMKEIQELPHA